MKAPEDPRKAQSACRLTIELALYKYFADGSRFFAWVILTLDELPELLFDITACVCTTMSAITHCPF